MVNSVVNEKMEAGYAVATWRKGDTQKVDSLIILLLVLLVGGGLFTDAEWLLIVAAILLIWAVFSGQLVLPLINLSLGG